MFAVESGQENQRRYDEELDIEAILRMRTG